MQLSIDLIIFNIRYVLIDYGSNFFDTYCCFVLTLIIKVQMSKSILIPMDNFYPFGKGSSLSNCKILVKK